MQGHQPHPVTPISDADLLLRHGKKRGNYNCGRCGLPKKGHKCPYASNDDGAATPVSTPAASGVDSSAVAAEKLVCATPPPPARRRRALLFDDPGVAESIDRADEEQVDLEEYPDPDESSGLPMSCLWEVLRRVPPSGLLSAAGVCRGWRETTRKLWRAAEELRVRVPAKAQIGFVGSILQKCSGLIRLSLRSESDVDATMLACIAFSCPNLQSLEILTSDSSINRISGDELSRFVADKRCLTSLKMEGCGNLGGFVFSSTSLSTLWLSDLHSLSKMIFNCPNLKEISLDFSCQENDSTDLRTVMDGLGRSCPKLQNIHIASILLSHDVVLALSAANLRGLRMLSLVLGSGITDASVAAIGSSFPKLELLDLSGSSISDSGIGMICNVFPETLSKLLLSLCPNITSSGIQFAAAELPRLELMDCGMTICDPNSEISSNDEDNGLELQKTPNNKMHLIYQKLIIKHNRLKKLSLWGCSGLDALYLNCPHLTELNLNSCRNLNPERLLLHCANLESVYASDCEHMLVKTIETQVTGNLSSVDTQVPSKRLPDGSKRVRIPYFCSPQPCEDDKKRRRLYNDSAIASLNRHRILSSDMEVSSLSTTCKALRQPSSEALPLQKTWFPKWNQAHLLPKKRALRSLVGQNGASNQKQNHLQVFRCQLKEVPVIKAGCMDEVYDILAERLVPIAAAESNTNFKHIVALCGPPGAGKSTLASSVATRVNKLWAQRSSCFDSLVESPEVAIVLPMDGFHLYRHQLDSMKDPKEAHARRGSPWTFDPERLLRCLTNLRNEGSVYVPSFDHGLGDPVEDDIFVSLQHKVVIVEGNYLLLDEDVWRDISSIFDEKWFIDVDIDKAMQRVLKRHISTGKPPDVAKWRIDYNDRPNAELIMKSSKNADLIIKSVDISP
ncbi:F-box/LRR-repeat protein 17 [Striga hermonthica]|uniref:F-box/LRR-repeat protein 17 n=1 Tax=Striga hermonthica TaxID=68872 RepID=A0A9N7REL7_STRHE|nr:F-box/LRR-repeat protein 17 [Striga hermonthica]